MKTYNRQIEDGIKTALYGLNALMKDEKIINNQLLGITGQLESLVDQAQQGLVEHGITADVITEQQLESLRGDANHV
jgi:hypothetical protein